MKLTPKDLDGISALRLEHYNQRAGNFSAGTRDHDVSQNITVLLEHIEGTIGNSILALFSRVGSMAMV